MGTFSQTTPLGLRLLTFFRAFPNYLGLLFYPKTLTLERQVNTPTWFSWDAWATLVILMALFVFLIHRREKYKDILFASGWFCIALIPTANVFPIGVQMAEHFLYLPSIGFFLLVGLLVEKSLQRPWAHRTLVVSLCGSLLLPLGLRTFLRNTDWKDEITFYTKTLETAPHSFIVYNNLGAAYDKAGLHEKALPLFKRAVELNPNYDKAWNNMGVSYAQRKAYLSAIPIYEKAIRLQPRIAIYHYHLGHSLASLGRYEEAIASFENALTQDAAFLKAHLALGLLYKELQHFQEAEVALENAIRIDPSFPGIHVDLGEVYLKQGKIQLAENAFEEALKRDPHYERAKEALQNLRHYQ